MGTSWTGREDKILIDGRAAGDLPKLLGNRLGRTAVSCKARLQWHGASTQVNALKVKDANAYSVREGERMEYKVATSPPLAPSVIDARTELLNLQDRRDLTARICGDPAPGRADLLARIEAKEPVR